MSTFSTFYSTISFLSSALVLSLLPWFIRFRSVPGLFTIAWLFVSNFLYGLNAAAFTGDALLKAPVYCDITTKIFMGMQILVPTAMLCYTFSIHDWMVRSTEWNVAETCFKSRNRFHATLCFLVPIAYMALHIIVQDHRFDIVEDVGCLPSSSSTALTWVLVWQTLIVPFCIFTVYGVRACRHAWRQHRRYYARYKTTWELIDSDLLFTNAPYGIIRILRLSFMIQLVMIYTLCAAYFALAVFLRKDDFTFSRKPDLSRIDVFSSLSNASTSVTTMRFFLCSGPLYSILLFAASIDRSILLSYPFIFKKYILRRPVGPNPDPSPGIDLSSLTPAPGRRRVHRRVVRKSHEYDPPLSVLDYDIPLPPRPDPGYRATAALPPVPEDPEQHNIEPRKPDPVHAKEANPSNPFEESKRGSSKSQEAMRQYVEATITFPMQTIPESPPDYKGSHPAEGGHDLWVATTRETAVSNV